VVFPQLGLLAEEYRCIGVTDDKTTNQSAETGKHETTFFNGEEPVISKQKKLFVQSWREEEFPVAVLQAPFATAPTPR